MASVTEEIMYTFNDGDVHVGSEPGMIVITGMCGDGQVLRVGIAESLFGRVTSAIADVREPAGVLKSPRPGSNG